MDNFYNTYCERCKIDFGFPIGLSCPRCCIQCRQYDRAPGTNVCNKCLEYYYEYLRRKAELKETAMDISSDSYYSDNSEEEDNSEENDDSDG